MRIYNIPCGSVEARRHFARVVNLTVSAVHVVSTISMFETMQIQSVIQGIDFGVSEVVPFTMWCPCLDLQPPLPCRDGDRGRRHEELSATHTLEIIKQARCEHIAFSKA